MLRSGAPNFPSVLSLDDSHDENADLKEFYESELPHLKKCSMTLIDCGIVRDIAVKINDTQNFHEDWRIYATEMGIDNKTIAEIKASAYCHRELEIFFAMDRIVRKKFTFGHIIEALLKTERYDVLKEIETFVRNLLPKLPEKQIINSTSAMCKNKNDAEEHCTIKIDPASFSEQKCELNYFQQHSLNGHFKNALKISDSPKFPGESLEGEKNPSAPVEEKLTVLIQHAESEISIAQDLSAEFANQGVIATTLAEVNDLTMYEPVNVLDTVFREVDFIVPVLSEKFVEEIHPKNSDEYLESVYAQNNRRLYVLLMQEYASNRYINFRVRPVIVEGMSRRPAVAEGRSHRFIREPIFAFSFRFPKEVHKLIKVLKKTKELKAQKLVVN